MKRSLGVVAALFLVARIGHSAIAGTVTLLGAGLLLAQPRAVSIRRLRPPRSA